MDRVRPRLEERAQGFYSQSYHWFLRLSCQVLSTLGSQMCLWEAEVPQKPFSMGVHTRHLCLYKLLAVGQLTPLGSISSTSLLRGKNKKQTISLLFINISRTPSRGGGEESKEEGPAKCGVLHSHLREGRQRPMPSSVNMRACNSQRNKHTLG